MTPNEPEKKTDSKGQEPSSGSPAEEKGPSKAPPEAPPTPGSEIAPAYPPEAPPPLSRNLVSYIGWLLSFVLFTLLVVLVVSDLIFHFKNPYSSMITYMVLPGFLVGGILLIFFGALLEWRRRHKKEPGEYPRLPVVNLNAKWQRKRLILGSVLLTVFFGFSSVGVYRAYHFTDSPVFCGQICHQVMKPEYTAYQYSPHARVSCAECHIGSGAKWYVKMKITGLYQVWAVLTHTYHLPIKTPVANLRPARETCEECHWPGKVSGSLEKEIWHFAPDQANTPVRYNLLLKVGGGEPEIGRTRGIHWHINENVKVRYWARDRERQDIPWVEVSIGDQAPKVFRAPDCPNPLPPDANIRVMDCMDCHNRPAHIYQSPHQVVDSSLAKNLLDVSLPYLKRYAVELLERDYPDTPSALKAIDKGMKEKYADYIQGPRGKELVDRNIERLKTVYQRNFFPEQHVSWRGYPNDLGHFEFPGCYRCHDDKHATATGEKIPNRCTLCHTIIDQAEGQAAYQKPVYHAAPFEHPRNMGDIWRTGNCTDCHGVQTDMSKKKIADSTAGAEPGS